MLKVIFDTVIFVRSLINPNSFWGKIIFKYSSKYKLIVSKQVLIEIIEVLQRPEIKNKFKTIEGQDWNRILKIVSQAEVVYIPEILQVSRDIKDDKFLATAKEAKVDYIVSEDQDLLILDSYRGIKIINAETFIDILEQEVD